MKKKLKGMGSISVIVILALLCGCDAQEVSKENLKSIETISTTIEEQSNIEKSEELEDITYLVENEESYQSVDKPTVKILMSMIDELRNCSSEEVEWWYNAVEKAELTAEDEVRLAKLDEGVVNTALLLRSNLTSEGLIATCEAIFGGAYGWGTEYQEILENAVERVDLTEDDEVRLANIDNDYLHRALILRSNLTAEGLIATCEAEFGGSYSYGPESQDNLKKAVSRIELTEEQFLRLKAIDVSVLDAALELKLNVENSIS